MKKLQYLTQYELYENIFKPIFGLKVSYPKSWSIEDILNGKFIPQPFINKHYPEIEASIKEFKEKISKVNNNLEYTLPHNERDKIYQFTN